MCHLLHILHVHRAPGYYPMPCFTRCRPATPLPPHPPPRSHEDVDVLALLQTGPAAVSIDASAYNVYHGGVINCSATGQHHVDHANTLVGYGIQAAPQKCSVQPKNSSYTAYCDTAWLLGAGGREWWGAPTKMPATLEECCDLCASTVGTPPSDPGTSAQCARARAHARTHALRHVQSRNNERAP